MATLLRAQCVVGDDYAGWVLSLVVEDVEAGVLSIATKVRGCITQASMQKGKHAQTKVKQSSSQAVNMTLSACARPVMITPRPAACTSLLSHHASLTCIAQHCSTHMTVFASLAAKAEFTTGI